MTNEPRLAFLRPAVGWQERARCGGVELSEFFGHEELLGKANAQAADRARDVADTWCRTCVVRRECLMEALATDEQWGIWGGHTRAQRITIAARIRADSSPSEVA